MQMHEDGDCPFHSIVDQIDGDQELNFMVRSPSTDYIQALVPVGTFRQRLNTETPGITDRRRRPYSVVWAPASNIINNSSSSKVLRGANSINGGNIVVVAVTVLQVLVAGPNAEEQQRTNGIVPFESRD